MKRYICYLLCLFTVLAVCTLGISSMSGDLVVDRAELLSSYEEEALRTTLKDISSRRGCDIAVVTVNDLEGKSVVAYADDFYDYDGGYSYDGILLLVCMETREFHITTSGSCEWDVTERAFDAMEDAFLPDLSDGNYYDAFIAFAEICDRVLDPAHAEDYKDYDYDYDDNYGYDYDYNYDYDYDYEDDSFDVGSSVLISLAVGFLISFFVTSSMKGKLKSVRTQVAANQYVRAGSMKLTLSHDNFLYRNVTRVARPKDNDSSHGGSMGRSGGSSHHRSSSGRSHGGRSGRF